MALHEQIVIHQIDRGPDHHADSDQGPTIQRNMSRFDIVQTSRKKAAPPESDAAFM
jgi:hypothetical protein